MAGISVAGRCLLVVAAGSYSFLSGCVQYCTLVGSADGVIVDVQVAGGPLPSGDYTIIARADGAEARLEETILAAGAASTSPQDGVVGDKHLFIEGAVTAERGWLQIGFREGRGPAEVALEVWRGSAMLGQETYTPRYTEVHPNGEHCPPELHQARVSFVVAAP